MQRAIRRQDRAASAEDAWRILTNGEYGVLCTVSADGGPYGTPLNYCLLDRQIYFHCALEGHKLDNLAHDSRVCFCVVGPTRVLPDVFSTEYQSALALGRAREAQGEEKQRALVALVAKYSPGFKSQGLAYIEKLSAKARVFRVAVEELSAKRRSA